MGMFLLEDEPGSDLSIQNPVIPSIEIYPNPFDQSLTLKFDAVVPSSFQLFNLEGSCLYQEEITNHKQQIQLDFLAPGVYILKFSNGLVRKVVKKN